MELLLGLLVELLVDGRVVGSVRLWLTFLIVDHLLNLHHNN